MTDPGTAALRLGALAVAVLHDLDLQPSVDGIVLTGGTPVEVSWAHCRQALAGSAPDSSQGRARLARWLSARHLIAQLTPAELADRARPVGLPRAHPLHPGEGWAIEHVPGHTLDLGLGIGAAGTEAAHGVLVIPADVWVVAGIDPAPYWPAARAYLDAMSLLAVQRWGRLQREDLRPMGDCDVVTLLASMPYRAALVAGRAGMTGVAVPMRSRGWTDLRAIDPAFAVAAAAATAPEDRGFPRPLLVTADELVMVAEHGRPAEIVLRDAAPESVSSG